MFMPLHAHQVVTSLRFHGALLWVEGRKLRFDSHPSLVPLVRAQLSPIKDQIVAFLIDEAVNERDQLEERIAIMMADGMSEVEARELAIRRPTSPSSDNPYLELHGTALMITRTLGSEIESWTPPSIPTSKEVNSDVANQSVHPSRQPDA